MPSFDTCCEVNMVEIKNALDQANKEISTRFDFKGSDTHIDMQDETLSIYADDDFKLNQAKDVLVNKLAKRQVDPRFLEYGKQDKISGNKIKQVIKIKQGIEAESAKKIVRLIKDSKLKVQTSIQGNIIRLTGTKKDNLQSAMALIKKEINLPLKFTNFRE